MTTTFGSAPTTATEPNIWVGCLACYNAGRLVGEWLEATEVDGLSTEEVLALMHKGAPRRDCEEVWVMDHENFGGLLKGECSPWEACEIAKVIDYCGDVDLPVAAFAAWRDNYDGSATPTRELVDEAREQFRGAWESTEAWAWDYLEGTGQLDTLPEWAESYRGAIVKAWLHDQDTGGAITTADAPEGGVYVFGC